MSAKVYVVTRGSYSDYRIEACFTDKALAEAHASKAGGEVEEYPLFERMPRRVSVYFKSTGHYAHLGEPHEHTTVMWEYEAAEFSPRARVIEYNRGHGLRSEGRDKEAVRKAFDDRWAQMRAVKAGIA